MLVPLAVLVAAGERQRLGIVATDESDDVYGEHRGQVVEKISFGPSLLPPAVVLNRIKPLMKGEHTGTGGEYVS